MTQPVRRRSFIGAAAGVAATVGVTEALSGAPTASAAPRGSASPVPASGSPAKSPSGGAAGFVHPGILHSREDLERMRSGVATKTEPFWSGYQALAKDSRSSSNYTIANTGQITSWGRGPSNFQNQAPADAAAAYQNALMWYVTQDVRYADKARDILDIWAKSLAGITGADGPLGAMLQGFKFANAAEILRYSGYSGWSDEGFEVCRESLRGVWYRAQSGYALYANGNWDDAAYRTIAAIAVLCDDRVMFEEAMRWAAQGSGDGAVVHRIVNANGQGQESGRDQAHEQLALGLMADAAQVAWNQGVDLYGYASDRILAGYEYDAKYNMGDDVPFVTAMDRTGKYIKTAVSSNGRGQFRPIYEVAYAHYVTLLGKKAPQTTRVVFRGTGGARSVEGYQEDHPGFGTLTYARTAPDKTRPAAAPGMPSGLGASSGAIGIELSWIGSVEPVSATSATTYTVYRADHVGGRAPSGFRVVASGLRSAAYTDRGARTGHTYHYRVTATNAAGTSAPSLTVSATRGLPRLWRADDVGSVASTGSTTFDGERFVLEDGGADIAGTSDAFRFVHAPLGPNGTITARIVEPLSSQYSKIGVMIRGGLSASAPHASMLIQGLPLAGWSGVWTVRRRAGEESRGTGSTPVPPTQKEAITSSAGFPISNLGSLPESATPLAAPYVEAAGDGYRLRMPYWVRISRRGDRLTGSISPDGVTWTTVGSSDVPMRGTVYAGLVLCSCLGVKESYAQTGTGAFDNVTVSGVWTVPAPTEAPSGLTATASADAVELAWTSLDPSARYTVLRSPGGQGGKAIATDAAPVGFGTRTTWTDATARPGRTYRYTVVKTNVRGRGPSSSVATAVMPRPTAPQVTSATTAFANAGEPFQYLAAASHEPSSFRVSGLPRGLKVEPATGLISGTPARAGSYRVTITATNATGSGSARLSLSVGNPLPKGWTHSDIGDYVLDERQLGSFGVAAVRTPGIASHDAASGAFTVRGAGSDLNVNSQGLAAQFARMSATGDATLTARVVSRVNGGQSDEVGLLMMKSLNPFDQMAASVLTSSGPGDAGSKQFLRRLTVAGGAKTTNGASGVAVPTWLRLERRGTTFTASSSDDGQTWTQIGSDTIETFGDAPYYLGLVVTSRNPQALNTTVFDHVQVS